MASTGPTGETPEYYKEIIKQLTDRIEQLELGYRSTMTTSLRTCKQKKETCIKKMNENRSGSHEIEFMSLSKLEEEMLLGTLEKRPGSRRTSTSYWNQSPTTRTAVYKLLKVTRWMVLDEDMIFDPLLRSSMVTLNPGCVVDDICGLVESLPGSSIDVIRNIRSLSVNHLLKVYLKDHNVQTLRKIDSILADVDISEEYNYDDSEIQGLYDNIKESIPKAYVKTKEFSWLGRLFKLVLIPLAQGLKVEEKKFIMLFEEFFDLLLQAIGSGSECYKVARQTSMQYENSYQMNMRNLLVTSEADLYICHEKYSRRADKHSLVAVVEVKSRDTSGKICGLSPSSTCSNSSGTNDSKASSCEDLTSLKTPVLRVKAPDVSEKICLSCTSDSEPKEAGNSSHSKGKVKQDHSYSVDEDADQESDEDTDQEGDVPDFDDIEERRINIPPNDNLRRLKQQEKLDLREFLPQLLGELMCTFHISTWGGKDKYHGTYRLGIAITGLLVQFVAIILHHEDDDFGHGNTPAVCERTPETLQYNEKLRTVVFLTRPLYLLNRRDRGIIMKTVACAGLLHCRY